MLISEWRNKYLKIVKVFIIIIYSVGVLGLILPQTSGMMASLTPVTLLLSFILLLIFHEEKIGKKFISVVIALFLTGLILEMIGVNTGKIFGAYKYGENLGPKIFNTPWMIGVNWVMLSYLTASLSKQWISNNWLRVIYGAFLMLLYDFFLEQSAPGMDLWSWSSGVVPELNYISWAIAAIVFQITWHFSGIQLKNKISLVLFNAMYLFFIILYLIKMI